jgi:hypothetical protein
MVLTPLLVFEPSMSHLSDQVRRDQEQYLKEQERRLHAAAEFLQRELQKVLSQPGSKDHHAPPGEPPLKQSGMLFASIQIRVTGQYAIEVFSDCPYIQYVQKKHPFWDGTIARCEPKIREIIFGGK